ncbi:MAG: hypothetical protein Q3999_01875 [Buchananella hordeovulneris]|nr:hypothetical protein [Buchananella hordeovulneris]
MRDSAPILVTGYGPFPGVEVNPSGRAVEMLAQSPEKLATSRQVVFEVLPVSYRRTLPRLKELLAAHRPALTICVGVDNTAQTLKLETLAFNEFAQHATDVDGELPREVQVIPGGATQWEARFDVDAAVAALSDEARVGGPLPVTSSADAGRYLCNAALAVITQEADERGEGATLFLHIPPAEIAPAELVGDLISELCAHEDWWGRPARNSKE